MTLCLMATLSTLTACTSDAMDGGSPTNMPNGGTTTNAPMTSPGAATTAPGSLPMTTDMLPDMSMPGTPTTSAAPEAAGVTSVTDARKAVEQIEDELERLSEVDDAQVIIAGNSAAVALEFEAQYQGGIDDRLRQIVKERIGSVISGVTNIAITDDRALMDQLELLGDRLESAADMTNIQNELNAIINKIQASAA